MNSSSGDRRTRGGFNLQPILGACVLASYKGKQRTVKKSSSFSDLFYEAGRTAFLGIHGLGGAPKEIQYLAKKLHHAGITSSVPVLPGHESLASLKTIHWDAWIDFLEERLIALSEKHGSIFIGGLSSGTWMALALAIKQPKRVAGLILYSTIYYYDGWNQGPLGFLLVWLALHTPMQRFYSFHTDNPPFGVKDTKLQRIIAVRAKSADGIDTMKAGYSTMPAHCFAQMHSLRDWVKPRLGTILHPTLLLHSKEDDLTSIRSSELVMKQLGSKDKRLISLDDCYHLITLDKQKHLVAQATIDFIERHRLDLLSI